MAGLRHDEQTRARVIQEFLECGRVDVACARVGVSRGCHYLWLKAHPDYAAAFAEARQQTADLLEDEAWRRAVEGVDKPVYQQGREVGSIREYSDTLMTWLLRGLRPERYNNEKVTLAGDKENPLVIQAQQKAAALADVLSPEQLEALRVKLLEAGK